MKQREIKQREIRQPRNSVKLKRLGKLTLFTLALNFHSLSLPALAEKVAVAQDKSEIQSMAIVYPVLAPRVSSKYGLRIHPIRHYSRQHQGVDLAAPENSHVRTVMGGLVVYAGYHGGYGKLVTVQHSGGYASLYAHLAEISVSLGQRIEPGTLIGRVGSSGASTGPHLHFEWRKDGVSSDPLQVFPSLAEDSSG